MNKARSCVKSVKLRWALACAFLLREWQKLLCHWNYHNDVVTMFDLVVEEETELGASGTLVGSRLVFTCSRCGHAIQGDNFETMTYRHHWVAHPKSRRVLARDWSKP